MTLDSLVIWYMPEQLVPLLDTLEGKILYDTSISIECKCIFNDPIASQLLKSIIRKNVHAKNIVLHECDFPRLREFLLQQETELVLNNHFAIAITESSSEDLDIWIYKIV